MYIQASLHADELPGMRTAWELKKRLTELEQQGQLKGVIELVPVANPIGLDQHLQGSHMGRFELGSGKNFNRSFVELSAPVAALIGDRLGSDAQANIALIRQTMGQVLDSLPAAASQFRCGDPHLRVAAALAAVAIPGGAFAGRRGVVV
ncbi:Succinylglutamate desuccinylase / Aspartoacylase family protein [compost metagenome]